MLKGFNQRYDIYLRKIFKLLCEKWLTLGRRSVRMLFSNLSEVMIMLRKGKIVNIF